LYGACKPRLFRRVIGPFPLHFANLGWRPARRSSTAACPSHHGRLAVSAPGDGEVGPVNRVGKLEAAFSGSAKGRSAVYFASLFNGVRVGCIQFRHQWDTVLRAIRLFRFLAVVPVFPIPVLPPSMPGLTGAASPASVYGALREKRRPALTPFIGVSRGPKQHGLACFHEEAQLDSAEAGIPSFGWLGHRN
jgi:hypothetical protein